MTSCTEKMDTFYTLAGSLPRVSPAQKTGAQNQISASKCCGTDNERNCLTELLISINNILPNFAVTLYMSNTVATSVQEDSTSSPLALALAGLAAGIADAVSASLVADLTDNIVALTSITTSTGVFCECYANNTVKTTPLAVGSSEMSQFTNAFFNCLVGGLPVTSDFYYSPDGTSARCIDISVSNRPEACIAALTGDVTQCGDPI